MEYEWSWKLANNFQPIQPKPNHDDNFALTQTDVLSMSMMMQPWPISSPETNDPTIHKLEVGEELLSGVPLASVPYEPSSHFNISFDYGSALTSAPASPQSQAPASPAGTPMSLDGSESFYSATSNDFTPAFSGRGWNPFEAFNNIWQGDPHSTVISQLLSQPPTQSFSPMGVNLYAPPVRRSPTLTIIPERCLYLTKYYAKFMVQAVDIPEDMAVVPGMIKATVETPSGAVLKCHIKDAVGQPGWFSGGFKGAREVGPHHLRVKLEVPKWGPKRLPAVEREASLVVARNNYKESLCKPKSSFEVDYTPYVINTFPSKKRRDSDNQERCAESKVWGLTCDRGTNRLFYTDRAGQSLSCVDPGGQVIFKSCPPLYARGALNRPTGICCDEVNRRLLVVDKDHHRVCFFSLDGRYITSFGGEGHANGTMHYPWDVAVSPNGDKIIVTDARNHRLQLFDRFGNFLHKYSIIERCPYEYKNNMDYPRGVTFNSDGTLIYATDFNANNILEMPVNYRQIPRKILAPGIMYRPQGIAVDAVDCLLVCDSKTRSLCHLNPGNGQCLSQVHSIGKEQLQSPLDVAVMSGHNIAVLDSEAKIRIF